MIHCFMLLIKTGVKIEKSMNVETNKTILSLLLFLNKKDKQMVYLISYLGN